VTAIGRAGKPHGLRPIAGVMVGLDRDVARRWIANYPLVQSRFLPPDPARLKIYQLPQHRLRWWR